MANEEHQDLLIGIAQGFYYSRNSISELAKKYNISRYYVEKYLDEATNSGLVNISIKAPVGRQRTIERKFKQVFPQLNVTVLKDTLNPAETASNVFLYAARDIQHSIKDHQIVGLSWGETMYDLIQHFNTDDRPSITFTQIMGENMKYNSKAGSTRMVEMAANRLGAQYKTIVAPLYIFDPETRKLLASEPAIAPTLALGSKIDLSICSVGTIASIESIPVWQQMSEKIIPPAKKKEVAGILYGRPYDLNGRFINLENIPVFSIPLEQILAIPRRISVVTNKFKTEATLGAIRGNLLNTLYLSESVANKIISNADEFN